MNDQPQPPVPGPNPPLLTPDEARARSWNMWCHLSALAGCVIPFGNILGPLIVWQMKKHEVPSADIHGKAALNFQITVSLAALAVTIVAFILTFFCIGYLLFPLAMLIAVTGMVFAVIAGVKANDGQDYKYPFTLNLIT